MEVDEIQRQVSKFQRVSSNGSSTTTTTTTTTTSDHNLLLNNQKIATSRGGNNLEHNHNHHHVDDSGGVVGVSGGIARLCGWPSSRIVRVSRASGGKDRHSKVLTSKGLRDRRVRLSVSTAIQFYDLQDRLGFDQPSKAVEWLLRAAASSIDELPLLDPTFSGVISEQQRVNVPVEDKKLNQQCNDFEDLNFQIQREQEQEQGEQQKHHHHNNKKKTQSKSNSKSPDCSSTSETSKGSGLSLSRSENRMKARERAREMASKKEKNVVLNHNNNLQTNLSENSSFTDLLTGGMNASVRRSPETRNHHNHHHWSTTTQPSPQPMDYFFTRPPQFNITAIDNHHHHHHNHFSFLQDGFNIPTAVPTGGAGESYNLNFSMTSSSSTASATGGVALAPGFSRGTLQSNLPYLQRFQSSSSLDGSTSTTNLPVFIVPNNLSDHFPTSYHLSYGGSTGDHHHKDKHKN